jgi:hypothetical protein
MTHHDPHYFHAGRKVSCASGFIAGRPVPLPPLEPRFVFKEETRIRKTRSAAWNEAHRKSLLAFHATRRAG